MKLPACRDAVRRGSNNLNYGSPEVICRIWIFSLKWRMHWLFIGGFIAAVIYMILVFSDRADNFLGGLCLGITFGMMIVGAIMTSKYAAQIRAFKMRLLHRK